MEEEREKERERGGGCRDEGRGFGPLYAPVMDQFRTITNSRTLINDAPSRIATAHQPQHLNAKVAIPHQFQTWSFNSFERMVYEVYLNEGRQSELEERPQLLKEDFWHQKLMLQFRKSTQATRGNAGESEKIHPSFPTAEQAHLEDLYLYCLLVWKHELFNFQEAMTLWRNKWWAIFEPKCATTIYVNATQHMAKHPYWILICWVCKFKAQFDQSCLFAVQNGRGFDPDGRLLYNPTFRPNEDSVRHQLFQVKMSDVTFPSTGIPLPSGIPRHILGAYLLSFVRERLLTANRCAGRKVPAFMCL